MEQSIANSTVISASRDPSIMDSLKWWKESHAFYPDLSKMARDMMAAPEIGAGVEREFSISGRVITKQRNRLAPYTIRDIMQYKC